VEEQAPELQQVLLSAVHELHQPVTTGVSPVLIQRVVQRALDELQRLHRGAAIERPRTRRALLRLGALSVAGALLVALGPAAVRDTARLLFVPWARVAAATPPALSVSPGNVSVPRGAALDIEAELRALADHGATIMVRPDSALAWTRIPMVHDSTGRGYVVRIFDINRNTAYAVEAGGLRSPQYRITVTDLPTVKQLSLELHYPAYTGLPPQKIDNGGDVAAVTGTTVDVDIAPTLPIAAGSLHFDDGTVVPLTLAGDGHLAGAFRVARDGFYRVDLVAPEGTGVPGSVQHSVEALVDHPPQIRIVAPGRDTRVTSIEEVPVSIRASDDYRVQSVQLRYSVNGGAEQVVALTDTSHRSAVDFSAVHTLFLEEMPLHAGDLVAYHATAADGAGHRASSDIYFLEVRPFGRDYHAADDNGGGGGGSGGGNNPGQFTQRQRELIAGTFNWQRDSGATSGRDRRANATTLAIAQGKLHADVAAQAAQMAARGMAREDTGFVLVQAELDSAATAMKPAEDGLGRRVMNDAIPAQEHSLQHLQAADAAYRDITVRRQNGGGAGAGGGRATDVQDLADLFELQTDKLKNQYESPRTEAASPVQQTLDSTQEKLKQLAARQQQENERQQRLADALQQRLGRQGGAGTSGSSQRDLARRTEEQARQLETLSRDQNSPELADAARRLQQAADAMRQAATGSSQQGRAALDRLREAAQNIEGAQTASQGRAIQELAQRATGLARQQREIASDVARLQTGAPAARQPGPADLAQRKDALAGAVQQLGTDAERVARETRGSQPKAAAAAESAADEIRNRQVLEEIEASKRIMRAGSPEYSRSVEAVIGETLDSVAGRLVTAAGSVGERPGERQSQALAMMHQLVRDLESLRDRTAADSSAPSSGAPGGQSRGQRPAPGPPGGRATAGQRGPGSTGQQPGSRRGKQDQPRLAAGVGGGAGGDHRQFRGEVRARSEAALALRRELAAQGVNVAPLDRAIGQLSRLQEATDPARVDDLQAAIVAGLKDFEFNVWRKFNGDTGSGPALGAAAQAPPEYRAMVEEYYRALARKGPR
ncbi:MAG: DUF4175 family protein, partial [Gemmatimonadales bacterium]